MLARYLARLVVVTAAVVAVVVADGPLVSAPAVRGAPPAAPDGPGAPRVVASAQAPQTLAANLDLQSLRKTDGLAPVLDKLYRIDQLGRAGNHAVTAANASALTGDLGGLIAARQLRIDDAGRVQVWLNVAGPQDAAIGALNALGMVVQRTDARSGIVQGVLPVSSLAAAAAVPGVSAVRPPVYGVLNTGAALTQGDAILRSVDLRNKLTASGAGVRVGVISDGAEGLAASQASLDLGPVDTTTCNVALQASVSPPPPPPSATAPGAGAEGTAMMEIVHDIAPNASLMFGYFGFNVGGTALDFNAAVNCLAAHTDVVVDDVSWYLTGPPDGSGFVSANTSAALNNPANPIRGYYTSVANDAPHHYSAPWVNSGYAIGSPPGDWWQLQLFRAGGGTTDAGFGLACSPSITCGDTVQVPAGGSFSVFLQWNDPFFASANDYDLLVQDNFTATVYLMSANRQGPSFPYPVEYFTYKNTHGTTVNYNIIIGNYKGLAAPRTFDMYIRCGGCPYLPTGLPAPDNYAQHNFNTLAGSVPGQSDAGGGVVSVGAISAANPPYTTIDYYSSRGPTADGRTKPDVTGIDCVAITGAAGFFNPFCGTSAAAPHAAGIAALLLSCNPMLLAGSPTGTPASNRATLHDALLNGAVDLGPAGVDNTYGHGRLDTIASAPLANCVDTDGDGYPDGLETKLGKSPTTYCPIMRADVDGDGVVSVLDLSAEAAWYNASVPPAPSRLDQDRDNKVTILDLTRQASVYSQRVSACP